MKHTAFSLTFWFCSEEIHIEICSTLTVFRSIRLCVILSLSAFDDCVFIKYMLTHTLFYTVCMKSSRVLKGNTSR